MRVALKHKAQLYRQLFTGLKSGLPIERLLESELLPAVFAPQGRRLARNIQEGKPLSLGLRAAGIVQRWEEKLLAIGEDSGRMDSVLADLAQFFESRQRYLAALKARLVYPGLIVLAAILLKPLPQLAAGTVDPAAYVMQAAIKIFVLYVLYKLLIVRPFENATSAAFSPLLIRGVRHVDAQHWLRMMYETAYLNLLTLCLESGLDAAQTLKLLRDGSSDLIYRSNHDNALRHVEQFGMSLAQALAASGIIQNTQVFSFLNSSEKTGTLHSDMRVFLMKKQDETMLRFRHFVKTLGLWLYLLAIGVVVTGYV